MSHTVRKAVIPVAGLGTRFLPATKAIPKELLPVADKPVIQHIVEELVASGIEEIVFVTSESKAAIENHFSSKPELEQLLKEKGKEEALAAVQHVAGLAKYVYVRQNEPLGLGHAVLQAKEVIGNEPFIVCGGDDIIEADVPGAKQLIDVYAQHGGSVMGVMEVPQDAVDRYGIADPKTDLGDGVHELQGIVEKPAVADAPSRLAVGGRWLLNPEIFAELETTKPGAGGEIQLTDAILSLFATQPVFSKTFAGAYRDCGNKLEYIKTVITYALKDPKLGPDVREYIDKL